MLDVATRGIQIAGVAVAARALVQAGDALTQSLSRLQNATGSVERAGHSDQILDAVLAAAGRASTIPVAELIVVRRLVGEAAGRLDALVIGL